MSSLNNIEKNNNKIYALFFKTGKKFEISFELFGIEDFLEYEEYYLVYNSTKKVSNEYKKYKLVHLEEISNGKTNSFYEYNRFVTKCIIEDKIFPNQMDRFFSGLSNCSEFIGLKNIDTTNVTSMYYMFGDCSNVKELDLSSWNTANITNTKSMFDGCVNLETLHIEHFDIQNIINTFSMFFNCPALKNIYVGENWPTDTVTEDKLFNWDTRRHINYINNKLNSTNNSNIESETVDTKKGYTADNKFYQELNNSISEEYYSDNSLNLNYPKVKDFNNVDFSYDFYQYIEILKCIIACSKNNIDLYNYLLNKMINPCIQLEKEGIDSNYNSIKNIVHNEYIFTEIILALYNIPVEEFTLPDIQLLNLELINTYNYIFMQHKFSKYSLYLTEYVLKTLFKVTGYLNMLLLYGDYNIQIYKNIFKIQTYIVTNFNLDLKESINNYLQYCKHNKITLLETENNETCKRQVDIEELLS